MGTPCEYCGSRAYNCDSGDDYEHCAEAEYLLLRAEGKLQQNWDEILAEELADYPDDDQAWEPPPVKFWLGDQTAIFKDDINTPPHYAGYKIEPITFIMRNKMPYADGNVVKYVCRHRMKNGLEDIQKAIKYLKFIAKDEYGVEL